MPVDEIFCSSSDPISQLYPLHPTHTYTIIIKHWFSNNYLKAIDMEIGSNGVNGMIASSPNLAMKTGSFHLSLLRCSMQFFPLPAFLNIQCMQPL